jgi:FtsH-binding integral membrane protein
MADTAPEVDATFRTQRRIVVAYFAVFLLVTLAVPALTLVLDWWSEGRLIGGMSPAFVMTAAGLYVFFFLLALAASSLSTTVEDRMLGEPPEPDEDWDEP